MFVLVQIRPDEDPHEGADEEEGSLLTVVGDLRDPLERYKAHYNHVAFVGP